jgi:hypothetical protein
MEAFILYLYVCYGVNCQWQANGVFERSLAYSKEVVNGYPSKEPLYSSERMCQRAAEKLKVKPEYWQCISSGHQK